MTEAEGKSSAIKKTTVIACNRFVFVCLPVQPLDGGCSLRSQSHSTRGRAYDLTQACLSILLRLDDRIDQDNIENFPLAQYAAQYWAIHARFENASSHIKNGMECLLDADKPYFAMWLWIYNEDRNDDPGYTRSTMFSKKPETVPL